MRSGEQRVIGFDGGATKSEWVYLIRDREGARMLDSGRLAAANFKLIAADDLVRMLRSLPSEATHVGVFLAGCRTAADRHALRELATGVWPRAHAAVGGDRDSGFTAAFDDGDGIIVIAGTGSVVQGRRHGRIENAGGGGQVLGDRGSGFDIGLHGLRHCLRMFDVHQRTIPLASTFLRELGLNSLPDLVAWAQEADKLAIARLATTVFEEARAGDSDLLLILQVCARRLAEYAWAVARRLEFEAPEIRLRGGVFLHHPEYVEMFEESLAKWLPSAHVGLSAKSAALGAAWLAAAGEMPAEPGPPVGQSEELSAAATEQPNPRSADLELLDTAELVDLFISDQDSVADALASCRLELQAAVNLVHDQLARGGRLFYAGAGTSGRLGVLDASEIPPTFGSSPQLVQGIIAGGFDALHSAVEGAEDNAAAGSIAIEHRGATASDVVCGITASGRTPFVLGALSQARQLGAATILLTSNPMRRRQLPAWDIEIDLPTGPELIAGSTRLKAGTATKLALNIISSCTMIRLGKVKGNFMVDLRASNAKLRDRAARMLGTLLHCSYQDAWHRLAAHNWSVRECLEESG